MGKWFALQNNFRNRSVVLLNTVVPLRQWGKPAVSVHFAHCCTPGARVVVPGPALNRCSINAHTGKNRDRQSNDLLEAAGEPPRETRVSLPLQGNGLWPGQTCPKRTPASPGGDLPRVHCMSASLLQWDPHLPTEPHALPQGKAALSSRVVVISNGGELWNPRAALQGPKEGANPWCRMIATGPVVTENKLRNHYNQDTVQTVALFPRKAYTTAEKNQEDTHTSQGPPADTDPRNTAKPVIGARLFG